MKKRNRIDGPALTVRPAGKWLCLVCLGILFTGCASVDRPVEELNRLQGVNQQVWQAPAPEVMVPRPTPTGSLWHNNGGAYGSLFVDYKARSVGDIVTIQIAESSSASNQADTTTERSSSLTAGVDGFMGLENQFKASSSVNPFSQVAGSLDSAFTGSGTTNRSGSLQADITARVVEVLPNGILRIAGSREITVNSEKQLITITGLIQPRDISSENRILSTRIADARICYTGTGVLGDKQKSGWLTRAFDVIWPF